MVARRTSAGHLAHQHAARLPLKFVIAATLALAWPGLPAAARERATPVIHLRALDASTQRPIDHCHVLVNYNGLRRWQWLGNDAVRPKAYATEFLRTDAAGACVIPDHRPSLFSRYAGQTIHLSCPEFELAVVDLEWKPSLVVPPPDTAAAQQNAPVPEPIHLQIRLRPQGTTPLPRRSTESLLSGRFRDGGLTGRVQFTSED